MKVETKTNHGPPLTCLGICLFSFVSLKLQQEKCEEQKQSRLTTTYDQKANLFDKIIKIIIIIIVIIK